MPEYADVEPAVVGELRAICLGLPETREEPAWTGVRWRVRTRTFAHVLSIDSGDGPATVLSFRSTGAELEVLRHVGHPFSVLGWGRDAMGMVLDEDTDWARSPRSSPRATASWPPRSSPRRSTGPMDERHHPPPPSDRRIRSRPERVGEE